MLTQKIQQLFIIICAGLGLISFFLIFIPNNNYILINAIMTVLTLTAAFILKATPTYQNQERKKDRKNGLGTK